MNKKVKNVLLKIDINGTGIVNYDDNDQSKMYWDTSLQRMATKHKNVNYAKKNFYGDKDNLSYKIKISNNCLLHEIFGSHSVSQNPSITLNENLLNSYIGSPSLALRGYLFADKKMTLKRKSAVCLTDAEQTCNAISYLETFSKSGKKNEDVDVTDNTFFKRETIGDISYSSMGYIDLMQLQFMSASLMFDRLALNPDQYELYKKFMSLRMPNFNSDLGYYIINNSVDLTPEYGFLFSNENMLSMVRQFLTNVLSMNIKRKSGIASTSSLKYKLVYDTLTDTFEDENGWIEIKTNDDINNVNFEIENFYQSCDSKDAEKLLSNLEKNYQTKKEDNNKLSEEKKEEKRKSKKGKIDPKGLNLNKENE